MKLAVIKSLLLTVALASIVSMGLLFRTQTASASEVVENFDSYTAGTICGQGDWSCSGTYTGTVNSDKQITLENSLSIDTASNVSNDWIGLSVTQTASTTYEYNYWVWHDNGAGDVHAIWFMNASSSIHTFITIESSGEVYVNGNGSSRTVSDSAWDKLYIQIDETNNQARINLNGGSWSSWVVRGITDNLTTSIRFGSTGGTSYIDNFTTDSTYTGYENVEIVDLNVSTTTVVVGAEDFYFPERVECKYDDADCVIRIDYTFDMIGSSLYMLEPDETLLENAIDSKVPLEEQYLLTYDLSPTVRSTSTIDTYRYFVYDNETGEGKIYENTKVYWVASTTEENEDGGGLLKKLWLLLKRAFPLSLYFDVYDTIYAYQGNENQVEKISLDLSDLLVADEWTATGTILQASQLEDTLPIWNTKIYPFLENLGHLVAFAVLLLSMFSLYKRV